MSSNAFGSSNHHQAHPNDAEAVASIATAARTLEILFFTSVPPFFSFIYLNISV